MPHRILLLHAAPGIPLDGLTGSSRHLREGVRALAALGHEVRVLARRGTRRAGDPLPDLPAAVEVVTPPPLPGALRRSAALDEAAYDLRLLARAREVAREFRPTLLYERYSLFSAAGGRLARELGIPLVLEVNAPLALERVRHEGLSAGPHLARAERVVLGAATRLAVVSTALAEHVARVPGVDRSRVRVVPNGVDPEAFAPRPPDPALRRRLGLEGRFVLGFVGSLKPWHAVDNLVRAVASIEWPEDESGDADRREPALLVVGDGPQRAALEGLAGELSATDRVRFAGAVPEGDVPAYAALFDVACAPYPVLEPFWYCPVKVFEAMAMGLPVVASRIGDLPHLIGARVDAPAAGVLVPPGEPAGFVEHAGRLRVAPERARAMGAEGRRRATAEYTWKAALAASLEGL